MAYFVNKDGYKRKTNCNKSKIKTLTPIRVLDLELAHLKRPAIILAACKTPS